MTLTDGESANAERSLRQAIASEPGSVQAHADLCAFLCKRQRCEEAVILLDDVRIRQPGAHWALSLKAAVLDAERRTDEALAVHEALIGCVPQAAVPWMNYGHALKAIGRLADAGDAYRRSLKLNSGNGFAWYGLADLRTVRFAAEDVASMEHALAQGKADLNRVQLHFALGKALGDLGRFELSFRHYERANALRGQLVPYDPDSTNNLLRQIEAALPQAEPARSTGLARPGSGAIFIVGMPRSGSTLVEQILASHPMIEGLGELADLEEVAASLGGAGASPPAWQDAPTKLGEDELNAMGARYLASTRRYRRTQRPYFTDKLPANWKWLGLIHWILPDAKIIDVRRHPMACCLSTFMTYFSRQTHVPANLADLARYYRDYVRAVGHFERMRPSCVHRIRYEKLVENFEGEVHRLLAYLGLPFDAACLRFHDNPRAVHTPSAQQVRRPINRDGLAHWRNYEPWLGPLKRELGAIGDI